MKTTYRKNIETKWFSLSAQSIIGDRQEQQDSVFVTGDGNRAFGIVCDGMGGHSGGTLASELTVNMFKKAYNDQDIYNNPLAFLNDCANASDIEVFNLCDVDGNRLNAGTTLAAFVLDDMAIHLISIGDSRIYLIRDGKITKLTEDLNYEYKLKQLLNAGAISNETYANECHNQGEALISFVGIGKIEYRNLTERPLQLYEEDRIVVMSDGVYKRLGDGTICEVAGEFSDTSLAAHSLLQMSGKVSKIKNQDNTTLVILRIKKGEE